MKKSTIEYLLEILDEEKKRIKKSCKNDTDLLINCLNIIKNAETELKNCDNLPKGEKNITQESELEYKANHLLRILKDNNLDNDDAYVIAEVIWDLFEKSSFDNHIKEGGE